MPFASKKQRRWMHKNKPEIAQRWEDEEKVRSFKPKKKGLLQGQGYY